MKTKLEHGQGDPRETTPTFTIETIEDYQLAKKRIAALAKGTYNGDADRELDALKKAVTAWDAKHDRHGARG